MASKSTSKKKKGRAIKLTPELAGLLSRKRKDGESFDGMLRRHFGYPTCRGEPQPLQEYYVLHNGGDAIAFVDEASARGAAITLAVKKQKKKTEGVIHVREIPWE